VPEVFSQRTLEKFEDASASIPLRQLDRAFEEARIRLGKDPGGPDGARRVQFRRYVASIDQQNSKQLNQLGDVLGALIAEVAASKQDFLIKAAESDGFFFTNGVFRPAAATQSFTLMRIEDLARIDDCGKRLRLIANDHPKDAIAGAMELVESVCRTVLQLSGEKKVLSKKAALTDIANSTLHALGLAAAGASSAAVASLGELRNANDSFSPRHARLAIGTAVAFASFVAETFMEKQT
jgi:hypothetical protein